MLLLGGEGSIFLGDFDLDKAPPPVTCLIFRRLEV